MHLRDRKSLKSKFKTFEQLFIEEAYDHSDVIGKHRNENGKIVACIFKKKVKKSQNENGTSSSKKKTPNRPTNYRTRKHLLESNEQLKIDLEQANDKIADKDKEIESLTRKILKLEEQLAVSKAIITKFKSSSRRGLKRKLDCNENSSPNKQMRIEEDDSNNDVENEQASDDDEMDVSTSIQIVDIENIINNVNNTSSQPNNTFVQQIESNLLDIENMDTYSSDDSINIEFQSTSTHPQNIAKRARFDRATTPEVENLNLFGLHSFGYTLKKEALHDNTNN